MPDSKEGTGQPGDIDKIVSGFLSELDALGESLRPAPNERNEAIREREIAPESEAAGPAKPSSYRNIDVLLMDDARFTAGRERAPDEIAGASDTPFRSQIHLSAGSGKRRIRFILLIAVSLALLGLLGVLLGIVRSDPRPEAAPDNGRLSRGLNQRRVMMLFPFNP